MLAKRDESVVSNNAFKTGLINVSSEHQPLQAPMGESVHCLSVYSCPDPEESYWAQKEEESFHIHFLDI